MIAVAAALLTTQPVFGGGLTTHDLVVTEISSTTLTATYDGSTSRVTVTPTLTDFWNVSVSSTLFDTTKFGTGWTEPDNNLFNTITSINDTLPAGPSNFNLLSESSIALHTLTNGDTLMNFGSDVLDGGTINLTFTDLGDVATAPDTGTTASLFALSLTGLAFLRRKLSCHLPG
jgi:hypothetical protein